MKNIIKNMEFYFLYKDYFFQSEINVYIELTLIMNHKFIR